MQFETKDTTYNDNSNFVKGHTYFYSVTALSKNNIDTSTSCQASWKSNLDVSPEVYITQASVEANSFVRVSYHITPPSRVIKLILERSDNGTTNFQPIDSLLAVLDSYVPEDQFIDDTSARVQTQSYYYRLVAYDDCNKTKSYNTARSILLQGFTDQTKNTLNWNSYETWNQGVERYTIYRILDEDPATIEMLGTTDPSRVNFVDLLSGVDPTKAVCYWVVANEISSQATSQSNTFCISKEPLLFMPNAFYPDGINHLLRPVPKPAFVDLQSFKMTVFNRWGQQLFETTDITMGWDGVINGQNAPAGLYTYLLNYKSLEGKEYTKRGTAALLR
jgi:gliding motility-associated-like protein